MNQRILFVCLGNICRSPLAEGIMLHLVKQFGLSVEVDSAGTSDYHIGLAPDKRTIRNAAKNGVDLSFLRARQFGKKDFENFDHIYVMDKSNYTDVLALCPQEEHKLKINLLLDVLHKDKNLEVPDPYYGDERDFEMVFQLIYKACNQLCLKLAQN